ncbi:MAG: hypothetical protein ABSG84_19120 [Acidobacteriaceae bacterium]|jgi:hypothetical protein
MNLGSCEIRIVAIAIRSQRLGFAVLEGSLGLVDWRTVHYRSNTVPRIKVAVKKLTSLIALTPPSVIVIERSRLVNAPNASNVCSICRLLKREAEARLVPMLSMKREDVRKTFRDLNARSKDAIAATIARMFPELASKLPPKRKIWHGEHPTMALFDAVALAIAFWDHQNGTDPAITH